MVNAHYTAIIDPTYMNAIADLLAIFEGRIETGVVQRGGQVAVQRLLQGWGVARDVQKHSRHQLTRQPDV